MSSHYLRHPEETLAANPSSASPIDVPHADQIMTITKAGEEGDEASEAVRTPEGASHPSLRTLRSTPRPTGKGCERASPGSHARPPRPRGSKGRRSRLPLDVRSQRLPRAGSRQGHGQSRPPNPGVSQVSLHRALCPNAGLWEKPKK